MHENMKQELLQSLDEARARLEELLPKVDPAKEIYPGWTIRHLLAHITGWDDATIASLRAHMAGLPPATPAERGIDEYNAGTVTSRQDLDLDHVIREYRQTRQILKTLIQELSDEKFSEPLIVAWGERGTVPALVRVFVGHEEEHARDIQAWLKNPDQPLGKEGK